MSSVVVFQRGQDPAKDGTELDQHKGSYRLKNGARLVLDEHNESLASVLGYKPGGYPGTEDWKANLAPGNTLGGLRLEEEEVNLHHRVE